MKNKKEEAILDKLNKVAALGKVSKNPVKAVSAAKSIKNEISEAIAAKKETKRETSCQDTFTEEKKTTGLYSKASSTLMFWSKFLFIFASICAIGFAVYIYVVHPTTETLIISLALAIAVPFISFLVFLLPSSIGQLVKVSEKLCEILSEKEFTIRTNIETLATETIQQKIIAAAETAPVVEKKTEVVIPQEPKKEEVEEETEIKPAKVPESRVILPTAVIDEEEEVKPERVIRRSASVLQQPAAPRRKVIEPVVDQKDLDEAFDDKPVYEDESPRKGKAYNSGIPEKKPTYVENRPYHDDPLEDIPEDQVKVLSPNGGISFYNENMRISDPKKCIISDADPDFYHTNLNCMHSWPAKKRDAFTFWRISTRRVAEHYSMAYCPTCFKNDAEQF